MRILFILILSIYLTGCKLNKIVNHHGVHNLEAKSNKLSINVTNINDINKLLGPPSTKSYFNNEVFIYLERKTSNSKLMKLGKKKSPQEYVWLLEYQLDQLKIMDFLPIDKFWAGELFFLYTL